MLKPILVGAGVGALAGYATGQDPLKSAVVGGATAGFGSAMSPSATALSQGATTAASTMPAHLAQTGAQQAASNAALSGFNPIQDAMNINPSNFTASEGSFGNIMGGGGQAQMPISQSMQNTRGILEIPSPNDGLLNINNTMPANTQTGPGQATSNNEAINSMGLGSLEEYLPTKRDIGSLALTQGLEALTPEEKEVLRHQQGMIMRGQTGSSLGQGGSQRIGGQYISRAR